MSLFTKARPLAIGVVVAAVALSGCAASKKTTTSTSATTAAAAPSAAASAGTAGSAPAAAASGAGVASAAASDLATGLKGDPAAIKLVTEGVEGVAKVKSVEVTGNITDSGQTANFDLKLASPAGLSGTVTYQGGTVQVVFVQSTIYVNIDQKTFAAISAAGGSAGAAETQQFAQYAGKWVKVIDLSTLSTASKGPVSKVNNYTDLNKLSDELKTASGTVTLADKRTINGVSTQGVLISDGSSAVGGATVYFQTDGDHLPIEIDPTPGTGKDAASGKIDFGNYNKSVNISAPAGAIDISPMLQGLLGGALGASPAA
jgi:hypothetical protein